MYFFKNKTKIATVLFADSSDLYYENVDYEKGTYKVDGKDRKLIEREHEIKIKGEKSIKYTTYETHRGPITNAIFSKDLETPIEKTVPLSFAWGGNLRKSGIDTVVEMLILDNQDDFLKSGLSMDEPWCAVVYTCDSKNIT